jgi:hypothetical protein
VFSRQLPAQQLTTLVVEAVLLIRVMELLLLALEVWVEAAQVLQALVLLPVQMELQTQAAVAVALVTTVLLVAEKVEMVAPAL